MTSGHSPDEIERGDDNPGCALPRWGCLVLIVVFCSLTYAAYRFAISKGYAWSVGW